MASRHSAADHSASRAVLAPLRAEEPSRLGPREGPFCFAYANNEEPAPASRRRFKYSIIPKGLRQSAWLASSNAVGLFL